MSRSGRISDLSDLVDQAKASRGDGAPGVLTNPSSQSVGPAIRSAPSRGPGPGGPADTRSLPPNAASGTGSGGGGADDASMSSFSRSVVRVARDSDSAGGPSRGGGSRPPPRGGGSSYGGGSGSSSYSSGRGSSRRSGTTPGSGQSNATDRLMSLVNELSQPRTPGGGPGGAAAGGYLPSQYTGRGGGGRSPPGSVRSRNTPVGPPPGPGSVGGSSSYSRRSSGVSAYTGTSGISSARNSRHSNGGGGSRNSGGARSGGSDPVGFIMPPQYAPGPPPGGDGASERSGDFTRDSRSSAASEEQGTQYSYGSQTSAGQSTMPTEYTNTGFPDSTFVGGPMGPDPSAGGSQVGSQVRGGVCLPL